MNTNILINKLHISNFRGLNNVVIDNLSNVNIFVGANNCGKTTVLEAVKYLGEPTNFGRFLQLALLRAHASAEAKNKHLVHYVSNIFQKVDEEDASHYHYKVGAIIRNQLHEYEADGVLGEISTSLGETTQTLDISIMSAIEGEKKKYSECRIVNGANNAFTPTFKPNFDGIYLHSELNYYRSCCVHLSHYIRNIGKEDILQILRSFDSNITDISIIGEDIYLHSKISGTMPLFSYGLGLQKAVLISSVIVYCKNGVILVDEIDNAIHVSAFEEIFCWFVETCLKYNVQAFITTHSAEAIDAMLKVTQEIYADRDPLRIITMRKSSKSNTTYLKIRSGNEAYQDRELYRVELRV